MFWTLLAASAGHAQYQTRAWLDWRTIETERFSFHYPTELESWARSVASKMEAVDSTVSRLVGFSPTRRIQVVIDDPYGISNGSAWPFLDKPALVFWATPPSPREDIGTYVSWADMLATHEFAHLAHLSRPSRNPAISALWNLLPVDLGPISRKLPRWMIEGYATYLEGVITGSGRPNGSWRPAILRQWAIEGRLPTYQQLNGMGGIYGGDFAYLGGSAFIEWLIARRGESSLGDLWKRLTAKRERGFDEAFTGVYGEPASLLYGRFAAELTAKAVEIRSAVLAASPDSGHVIQHLARETGDPAISTDGGRVALVVSSATKPARVVIWSTVAEPDTAAERARSELRRSDPEDVPAIRVFPPPKKDLATLHAVGGLTFQGPRFFRDGRLLVWRNAAIGDGSYAPDLFIWDPLRKTVKRVTRRANVRQGDPAANGLSAAALRCAGGHCDLVLVDVLAGGVRIIAPGSDTRSFDRPRLAPDGRSILASVHDNGRWRIGTISIEEGAVRFLSPEDNGNWFDGSYANDSMIVATTDRNGIPTVVRLRPRDGSVVPIAQVTGAAVGGEINPADQSVWFLAMHSQGWDLRSTPLYGPARSAAVIDSTSAVGHFPNRTPVSLAARDVGEAHEYGLGPRKWLLVPGLGWSDEGASLTIAVTNTDIVGRYEMLAQWQGGLDNSWKGASIALTSRASRGTLWSGSGFIVRQQAGSLTSSMRGGALSHELSLREERSTLRLSGGGTVADLETPSLGSGGAATRARLRTLGFVSASFSRSRYAGTSRSSFQFGTSSVWGRSGASSVLRSTTAATVETTIIPISVTGTFGHASTESEFEQFAIGGLAPAILHPAVLSQRIAMPVLPATYAVGKQLATYRVSVPVVGLRAYYWGGRVYNPTVRGAGKPRFERVAGLDWSGVLPQIPAIGTPTARLTAGGGYWLNAPAGRSATRFYIMSQFGDWAR